MHTHCGTPNWHKVRIMHSYINFSIFFFVGRVNIAIFVEFFFYKLIIKIAPEYWSSNPSYTEKVKKKRVF
jgi:hypothetical protein